MRERLVVAVTVFSLKSDGHGILRYSQGEGRRELFERRRGAATCKTPTVHSVVGPGSTQFRYTRTTTSGAPLFRWEMVFGKPPKTILNATKWKPASLGIRAPKRSIFWLVRNALTSLEPEIG